MFDYIHGDSSYKMVRKTKKRQRDPARPKRAMTAFLYFACAQRKEFKRNGEKMSLPEQSKRIAALWKIVGDKGPYEAEAAEDKARYTQEMENYTPPTKIKRPRSSYAFFMKAVRAEVAMAAPDKSPRELMTDIAEAWKKISNEEKKRFTEMATTDKIRYQQEKDAESSI